MATLRPRPLGSSGLVVSALSLGSWRTYERLPAQTGVAIMRAARDAGITFFDDARYDDETGTAPISTGYSEVVFGDLFRRAGLRRDEVVLANKLWWEFWPEQSAAAELEGSLRRMGFDHVDLIYACPPPPGMSVADLVGALGGLIDAGKAAAWGMLNWPSEVINAAVAAADGLGVALPCAAQLPYSLVQRSPVEDPTLAAVIRTSGIGVIASFSLAGGVLSGKYLEGSTGRAEGTLDRPGVRAAVTAASELVALAERLGTTAAALALAFPLTNPSVTSVLFGATSAEQVRANCAAVALHDRLDDADLAMLSGIGLSG